MIGWCETCGAMVGARKTGARRLGRDPGDAFRWIHATQKQDDDHPAVVHGALGGWIWDEAS